MSQQPHVPRRPYTYAFAAGVLLVVSALGAVFHAYAYDDPYITFRYAQNLLAGNGLVYNAGEPVLSTTTPGYALLLAALGLVFPQLPLLGNLLSAAGLGLGALMLYLWACEEERPLAGAIAGALLLTFPLCISTFGSEMCVYIGLALAALYLHRRGRPVWAMALAGAATLVRPDGLLVAGLIAGLTAGHLFLAQRRIPLLVYALILTPWIAYGTWAYGSPLPVTLSAKQAQGRMAISDSFVWGAYKIVRDYARQPPYWLFVPLGALGAWRIAARRRQWLILLAWTACQLAGYALLGVSRYFWYYAPLVPGIVVCVAVGLDELRAWTGRSLRARGLRGRSAQWALVALCMGSMLWANAQGLIYYATHPDVRLSVYRRAGQWIDAHLPQDASVGTLEVGIIGYYARRRIVGFAGLLQPELQAQMTRETTYREAGLWALQRYRPDYLAVNPDWFPDWQDTVLAACRPLERFGDALYQGELVVYRCHERE
jgi:hypothetical protein